MLVTVEGFNDITFRCQQTQSPWDYCSSTYYILCMCEVYNVSIIITNYRNIHTMYVAMGRIIVNYKLFLGCP